MKLANPKSFRNGQALAVADISAVAPRAFRDLVANSCSHGGRLCGLVTLPGRPGSLDLVALAAHDRDGRLNALKTGVSAGGDYPSLTAAIPAAQAFERAIWETDGLHPEGHPWLKPLRRHPALEQVTDVPVPEPVPVPAPGPFAPRRSAHSALATSHPFFQVQGAGIHEVAVGPVHAGIIALGLGLGGTTAALFHTLNHSVSKMVAFFCVGNLAHDYGTRDTRVIHGLLKTSRLAGVGLLVAVFALVGMPPSSVFMSELWIARDGIAAGHLTAVVAFLLGVGVIFIVLLRPILGMAWAPADAGRVTVRARALDWPLIVLPLVLLAVLGLWMPEGMQDALTRAAGVLRGAP